MTLRVIWQYMDRSVTKKILYGPKLLRSIWYFFGDGPVHILPYDPKWHELFAILYFLSKIMQVPGRSIYENSEWPEVSWTICYIVHVCIQYSNLQNIAKYMYWFHVPTMTKFHIFITLLCYKYFFQNRSLIGNFFILSPKNR
jgi:hypothetical protein